MAKQARNTGRNWYVIHTYSGYEDAVREALLQRIESMNMQDAIFDVIVPKETQIVVKKGKPKTEKKRLFPGYVLVDMIVNDESWYVVRNTPNVTGFVGSGTIPVPVSGDEFGIIERYLHEDEAPKFKITLSVKDLVMILDGPFATYEGVVNEIDEEKGKLKVMISIFGRETPVELDFDQVKKK
ncbi:transcription termination/antitermination factor NusG [Candidatus Peregrinibacteria bacterium]|jgi:transcription termination/antitermination protein NusG|nr:transcription termination/antitermination factor NusG [Candidatus Peregrinibacteria bacterium]MBT4632007.1 transcription termination/antitermination factor NusG [Candidatus Peregrinibacteria bacterium]MBT5516714.1 transcription termination/antitermination factor NusG [Candidatus Peregrinibacteria bacterium]MBT5823790.1 transcription termination/antitermination factor NusG [Candidatus Peregrinibacteria bacterium]